MSYEYGIISGWLFLSFAVSLVIAVYSWNKRILANSFYLSLLTFATAEWALAGMFEAAATDLSMKILWSQISYIGIVFSPLFYLLFALSYSHRDHLLTRRNIILASILPCITLIVAMTNNMHHLLWLNVSISDYQNIGIYKHGVWFFVSMTYAYVLVVSGLISIIKVGKQLSKSFRSQLRVIIFGAAIPLLANFIYVFEFSPIPGLDWTPIAFGISGFLFAVGVFRYRMLSIVPLVRDFLVETMNDGLLVLDLEDQVVDVNPTMGAIIGLPDSKIIGRNASRVLSGWPDLLNIISKNDEYQTILSIDKAGHGLQYLDIQLKWITLSGGNLAGRMILCRNVTELEEAKIALRGCEEKA